MDKNNIPDKSEYEYHYNRDERLSMMPESVLEFKKKKRKNRSLLILWLDIALIVILSSGFLIYQKISGNSFSGEDYSFSLKTFVYNDNLLISITSVNKTSFDSDSDNTPAVPVELTVKLSKIDDFYKKIFDVLPQNSAEKKTYRISIPLSEMPSLENTSYILVNIKFENSSINIKHKLVYEK